MKLNHYIRILLVAGSAMTAFSAQAIPNLWGQGYGQGNAEYTITSEKGLEFTLNCTGNPDNNGIYQHSVIVTLPDDSMVSSRDEGKDVTVVMNHQQYAIPSFLGWRNGDNAWYDFIKDIRQAGQFEVYINNRKAGAFSPDVQNAQKVLPTLADCTND
ncbi:hypothetical protein D3C72_460680 [compost metagenome]